MSDSNIKIAVSDWNSNTTLTFERLGKMLERARDSVSLYGNAVVTANQNWNNEYQVALDRNMTEAISKPKIIRKHKIKDLILAEITKCKLKDYEKSQRVDYIQLGLKDFCDFIQQENLGRISDWLDEIQLVWNEYKIQCVKTEDRIIEIIYLPIVKTRTMFEEIKAAMNNNFSSIDPLISPNTTYIYGGNKSGKSLYMKTLKNRHNSVRGMSSTIFVDDYATIIPKFNLDLSAAKQ